MRNYQILDVASIEPDNVLLLTNAEDNPERPHLFISREGAFVSLSASFGPLEIALRLNYEQLKRRLEQLHPVPGLATTRQVGTTQSYLSFGLTHDERLVMRPTLASDASGHLTFNLVATSEIRQKLFNWLEIEDK